MPLNLHADCKSRLLKVLTEALPTIQVKHGMFIDRLSAVRLVSGDSVLPQKGKLHDQLIDYIDEFPLTDFVLETLRIELWELDRFASDSLKAKLSTIEGYYDSSLIAMRLIESFDSLPWRYRFTFALPEQLSGLLPLDVNEVPLSSTVRLIRATDGFAQEFPLVAEHKRRQQRMKGDTGGLLSALLFDEPPTWNVETPYLQVLTEGFVGQYGRTSTILKAERLLRAFCGLGIAVRLFAHQHKFPQGVGKSCFFYVHRQMADGTWSPEDRLDVNDATDRGFVGLEMHTLDGTLTNDEDKVKWAMYRLRDIAAAFSAEKNADSIMLASQWLFDSHAGRDELLSFIQAMVVLEILLGDKKASDEIGIGELIRNRCAYLIGDSHEERTRLLDDFNKIYRVRSQIVHSGKHKLTLEERLLFSRLRWMCRRVINKELQLLKADPGA